MKATSTPPAPVTGWPSRITREAMVDPATLKPHDLNWRVHPSAQAEALTDVLDRVGWVQRVIVNERTGNILDGHLRVAEAIKRGSDVPVVYVDLSEEEERLVLATMDPLAAMAGRDDAILAQLLDGLDDLPAAIAETLRGIEVPEVGEQDADAQIDRADELREQWGTERGQVWQCGPHRLMCGDSANVADVTALLGEERATVVFTDPPYGVAIGAKNRMLNSFQPAGRNLKDIEDDALSPDDLKAQLLPAFVAIREHVLAEDGTLFMTAPQGGELGMMMMMMMKEAKLPTRHVLIWKKNQPTFSMGRLDYDYAHEPILLTWGKRHKRPMLGEHRTSVWEIDKPRASAEHPTMKPVALYVNAYLNNSDAGDVVYDAYCGSGTALIAAEQTGRLARCMEIDPGYVAVALQRYQDATGTLPIRL